MKKVYIRLFLSLFILIGGTGISSAQSIRMNAPFWLAGSPNIGAEFTISRQITLSGDALWMPYMKKSTEEVFRVMQLSAEARYYVSPQSYYTNDSWDGFYVGPYAMYGNFNIGLLNEEKNPDTTVRRVGWGVSGGVVLGYKLPINHRWAIDFNLGGGYVYLQYNKHHLGGVYADYPFERKATKSTVLPIKAGIYITYNLFR